MLRDPLTVKKCFADHFWSQKNPICKNPKKTLEPLDLLATVGQSCVCVNVSVLVSVCVCECSEERRCGVVTLKSLKKTHTNYAQLFHSFSFYLCLSH